MRRYVYALAAATIMSAAMPVMAEETSTEEETSIEVDGTEESATGEDRASEIEKLIQQLEKQIAELKAELKTLRGEDATAEGDIVYQDDYVIVTYNGLKENEYGDGYTINFIIENQIINSASGLPSIHYSLFDAQGQNLYHLVCKNLVHLSLFYGFLKA